MTIVRLSTLTALALVISAAPALADEGYSDYYHSGTTQLASHVSVASMSKQIAEMEAKLASFRSVEARLAALESSGWSSGGCDAGGCDAGGCDAGGAGCGCDSGAAGCGCDSGCSSCGCVDECCCNNWMYPHSGLTAMAEVVWLRPQDTFSDSGINDFQHGSRYTVGWMNECAREWRIRYFELGVNSQFDNFINIKMFDAEYAGRFQLCNFDGELAFGLRYADWHESAAGAFGGMNFEDSIGPTIALTLKTDIWYNLDLFANARYSHQFGHPVGLTLGSFTITELSLGLQYNRDLACGTAFVRGAFETQNWAINTDTSDEDMGFVGFGVALGVTR